MVDWTLMIFLGLFSFIWCVQVLDENKHQQGLAGSLFHHHDGPGHSGVLGHCHALPGLQEDQPQGRVEEEPRGFPQHLGPQLPLWNNLGSDLPGLRAPLWLGSFPLLHPQLFSRSVLVSHRPSSNGHSVSPDVMWSPSVVEAPEAWLTATVNLCELWTKHTPQSYYSRAETLGVLIVVLRDWWLCIRSQLFIVSVWECDGDHVVNRGLVFLLPIWRKAVSSHMQHTCFWFRFRVGFGELINPIVAAHC